ncbi:MAG: Rrf2 family transcriptional regulator [Solirubrobacterales bacterium]|nr:Rrf2 family transcriptional regulator [Solirubrobacterales bacterium]
MRISAKADYAVRALAELAAADEPDDPGAAQSGEAGRRAGGKPGKPVKAERIATAQGIPLNFLENILGELRHAGLVRSHRGAEGGFRLARPATEVTVADVIRAVEGPLASVRGGPPEDANYDGAAQVLPQVWIAVRVNLRRVMERVTIADVAEGKLPASVLRLTEDPGAWVTR